MSALDAARRARATLLGTVAAAAALWALAGLLASLLLLAGLDALRPIAWELRVTSLWLAGALAIGIALTVVWRGRNAGDLARVALYIEERVPALEYALVTAVTSPASGATADLEARVAQADVRGALRPAVLRAVLVPLALVLLLAAALAVLPAGALARIVDAGASDVLALPPAAGPAASRLSPVAVRVTPPAYAGTGAREIMDPASVSALAGSAIEIRGRGASFGALDSLRVITGADTVGAVTDGDQWSVRFALPAQPVAVRLVDRAHERLLALEPLADLAPVVVLLAPARDTTYNTPRGRIALAASADDDIGLATAAFEVLHTSGSGERFQTGRRETGAVRLPRTRSARISGSLQLDTMRLGPGDILHIRALATDGNDRTGPGRGASDTRTIRIADPRQRDTVSIQLALEIPIDTSVLSQRALIIRAESLLRRQRRLRPDTFRVQAVDLGARQRQLRERVQEVIDEIENESEDERVGSTVVSRFLTQAASAMIDAENELGSASVIGARPHMYRALRLLQQARDATARYYLRGPLPKVVVDIDRARLRGRDSANVAGRSGRPAAPDPRRALLPRLDRAATLAERSPTAAADSLTVLRLDALAGAPDAAEALGQAASALRAGAEARAALLLARRRLERRTESAPGLTPWQAAP